MKIKLLNEYQSGMLDELKSYFDNSRFKIETEIFKQNEITISKVRLKESKPYCGNHPGSCQNPHDKKRKGVYLEGKDWIEFNDLLNDFMDKFRIAADISSTSCIIRKDMRRRIKYGMVDISRVGFSHFDWDKKGTESDYKYCVGLKPPKTKFPKGTPGGSK